MASRTTDVNHQLLDAPPVKGDRPSHHRYPCSLRELTLAALHSNSQDKAGVGEMSALDKTPELGFCYGYSRAWGTMPAWTSGASCCCPGQEQEAACCQEWGLVPHTWGKQGHKAGLLRQPGVKGYIVGPPPPSFPGRTCKRGAVEVREGGQRAKSLKEQRGKGGVGGRREKGILERQRAVGGQPEGSPGLGVPLVVPAQESET